MFRTFESILVAVLWAALVMPAAARAAAPTPEQTQFNKTFADWKDLLAQLRTLQEKYQLASGSEKSTLEEEYTRLVAEGQKMLPRLGEAAEKAYAAAPNQDPQVTEFLLIEVAQAFEADNFEDVYRIGKLLIDNKAQEKSLFQKTGIAAFAVNDLARAREYLNRASDLGEIDDLGRRYRDELDRYEEFWKNEKAIREAEAKEDDLPRVKLATSKGDIVIELFENEAPIATANFIHLVEKGFYDGTKFHRVIPGFMAQGGDPEGNGSGGPGYNIPGEVQQKNHRIHFRGSLSMAHRGDPDSGGSQFFLTFVPTPHLNGKHTVFGRVIEGMDVLSKIERTERNQRPRKVSPDVIVKATVLRKRDHAYEPKKLPSK